MTTEEQIYDSYIEHYEQDMTVENDSIGYTEFWGFGSVDSRPDYYVGQLVIEFDKDVKFKKFKNCIEENTDIIDNLVDNLNEYEFAYCDMEFEENPECFKVVLDVSKDKI